MPTLQQTVMAIYGAYRLARLDAAGMSYFDTSAAGFWRSFFAAAIIAPFYAMLLAIRFPIIAADADPTRFLLTESIAYVVSWTAYPLVMASLTQALGCRSRFQGYIIAYNWSMVLQIALVLFIALLSTTGVVPKEAGQFLSLATYLVILGYVWFIARIALGVPALTAAGIVAFDIGLSYFIDYFADRLY
jgi:hypothetical protein